MVCTINEAELPPFSAFLAPKDFYFFTFQSLDEGCSKIVSVSARL
jgi:hypothetical protein